MASNSDQNPISTTTSYGYIPALVAASASLPNTTTVAMPSLSYPLLQCAPPPWVVNQPAVMPESKPKPNPYHESESGSDADERRRVAKIMEDGFDLLLCGGTIYSSHQHTLLGLKVTFLDIHEKQIHEDFKGLAVATHRREFATTYELQAEEAFPILLHYAEHCKPIHSCSIVFTEFTNLRDRILSSNIQRIEKATNIKSTCGHTEVVLFVIAHGQIDDKGISNIEQLKNFLSEHEEKIHKVHATCLAVRTLDENQNYCHHVIGSCLP